MNILQFTEQYPELNITIKAGDLKEAIEHCVKMTCKELEQKETDTDAETYSSPDQVAKNLDVSKSTLWRWAKQNYLVPIEVGGKRRYRMSDIKKILEGKKPIK